MNTIIVAIGLVLIFLALGPMYDREAKHSEEVAGLKLANEALAENNEALRRLLKIIDKAKERTPGGTTGAWPEIKNPAPPIAQFPDG